MKTRNDDFDLALELRALRPSPRAEFVTELDRRAAAGFSRDDSPKAPRLRGLADRLRSLSPRPALAAVAAVASALVVATGAIVAIETPPDEQPATQLSQPRDRSVAPLDQDGGYRSFGGVATDGSGIGQNASSASGAAAAGSGHRDVERATEIVLNADPADVDKDAEKVFDAVHAVDGIVLRSSVQSATESTAEFELLIPAGKLGDALNAFSRIDEVRSRREATLDITAPTVSARELLRDSRARTDGLLAQLADAESEDERATVEAELRRERRHAARLRARLDRLERRANFARVTLRIESRDASGSGGAWGIGDAFRDAGRILGTATAIAVVALAALTPLALIALLAWLANRAWLRRRREQALG